MKINNLFKICIILMIMSLFIDVVRASDDVFIINENKISKNNDYTIILNEKISNNSVDEDYIYLSTKNFLYGIDKNSGTIIYKINIVSIQKIELTENYIYVTNYFNVYKISKLSGEIISKYRIKNTDIFTYLNLTNKSNGVSNILNIMDVDDGISLISGKNYIRTNSSDYPGYDTNIYFASDIRLRSKHIESGVVSELVVDKNVIDMQVERAEFTIYPNEYDFFGINIPIYVESLATNKNVCTDSGSYLISCDSNNLIFPPQFSTPPTYVIGGLWFNTTDNKLYIGGATSWEKITSV